MAIIIIILAIIFSIFILTRKLRLKRLFINYKNAKTITPANLDKALKRGANVNINDDRNIPLTPLSIITASPQLSALIVHHFNALMYDKLPPSSSSRP